MTDSRFNQLSIGDRLRWLMEKRRVTQVQVAAAIGVTQSAISNIVNDSSRRPRADTLVALADYFNVRPYWILTGQGDAAADKRLLTNREARLIEDLRSLDGRSQQVVFNLANALASVSAPRTAKGAR